MNAPPALDAATVLWRIAATLFFVLLNGFFVAAEFALVKVRGTRVRALAEQGVGRAVLTRRMLGRLDLYLSSCQFGITVASLILGWLAEPAVAQLLIAAAGWLGWTLGSSALLHGVALAVALSVVTVLHMTLGEQAPKIWAIQRPEPVALAVAYPLRVFTFVFTPLIWLINRISNTLLRLVGSEPGHDEPPFTAEELRSVLGASARAGHISSKQQAFAENVLRFIHLEVRHILLPRNDVVWIGTDTSPEEALRQVRESGHSRFPLCEEGLDSVKGIVHAKDLLAALSEQRPLDLAALARPPVFVPDTQPLGTLIVELRAQGHCAVVLDEHGTAIGLAFLEDALEEIVGPIRDEFDTADARLDEVGPGVKELRGDLALPEAADLLGLDLPDVDDTIGGHVVSSLGRLPEPGDQLQLGDYCVTVLEVERHRVLRLQFDKDQTAQEIPDLRGHSGPGSPGEPPVSE